MFEVFPKSSDKFSHICFEIGEFRHDEFLMNHISSGKFLHDSWCSNEAAGGYSAPGRVLGVLRNTGPEWNAYGLWDKPSTGAGFRNHPL